MAVPLYTGADINDEFYTKFNFMRPPFFIDSGWGLACTTFCLDNENQPIYGRNFDWRLGDGHIIINIR